MDHTTATLQTRYCLTGTFSFVRFIYLLGLGLYFKFHVCIPCEKILQRAQSHWQRGKADVRKGQGPHKDWE
jgi:hypothetical protein